MTFQWCKFRTLTPQQRNTNAILSHLREDSIKVEKKFDVVAIFEPYTSSELELLHEIKKRGGPDKCLKDEQTLEALAKLSQENHSEGGGKARGRVFVGKPLALTATELRQLHTPVDVMLKDTLTIFESKLDIATSKLEKAVDHLRTLASSRPYRKIADPVRPQYVS